MEIRIKGKYECNHQIPWIGEGFVFVDYLDEDIFLGNVFVLKDGTEICLQEIKIQFESKEPITRIGHGWKCLCRFDNLDLEHIPAIKDWFDKAPFIIATRKE